MFTPFIDLKCCASLRVPDLTLIDLPGITRVPANGSDQTEDVEKITKDMASRYIKVPVNVVTFSAVTFLRLKPDSKRSSQDERAIILAVMPANVDMVTKETAPTPPTILP